MRSVEIIVHIVAWWAIGLLGGVAQATNHRLISGFCVVMAMSGFTATTLNVYEPPTMYAAARGGNDYHNAGAVCLKNVKDPVPFTSQENAQARGYGPCERCILHQYHHEDDRLVARAQSD